MLLLRTPELQQLAGPGRGQVRVGWVSATVVQTECVVVGQGSGCVSLSGGVGVVQLAKLFPYSVWGWRMKMMMMRRCPLRA